MVVLHPCGKWSIIDIDSRQKGFTCADTFRTIDQEHGHNWHVPLRFNQQVVVLLLVQQCFVGRVENDL